MGILLGFISFLYIIICIGSIGAFIYFYKKAPYSKQDIALFVLAIFINMSASFFISNHLAMSIQGSGIMTSIGYSIVPITQFSFALISYPILQMINRSRNLRLNYAPAFLGAASSLAFSYGFASIASPLYWNLLGKNIYG